MNTAAHAGRPGSAEELGAPYQFENPRLSFVNAAGMANPVQAADFERITLFSFGESLRRRAAGPPVVVLLTQWRGEPAFPSVPGRRALHPSVVAHLFAIGIPGYVAGRSLYVADAFGLADPVGSRLPILSRLRSGHEKALGTDWVLARFARPGSATPGTTPQRVNAARSALGCGQLRRLIRAVREPLSWGRFWSNVGEAWRLRSLRIPQDPREAETRFCTRRVQATSSPRR